MEAILFDDINEHISAEKMEQNLREQYELREFKEINSILPSLLNEGLITEIECRVIASQNQLSDKQGAVYRVMMSKTKADAAYLAEVFRTLYLKVHGNEDSSQLTNPDYNEQEVKSISPLKNKSNPLLNDMIIKRLFGFLSLTDLDNARRVCRQWNSTVEICLRKRSVIRLHPHRLTPETFVEVSKYSLPDLPFSSFIFLPSAWCISDIQIFFEKWGTNIKEVNFDNIILSTDTDYVNIVESYDMTPWIAMAPSICRLKIKCQLLQSDGHGGVRVTREGTSLDVSLEKLVSAKTVILQNCYILTKANNKNNPISPVNFKLVNVGVKQDGTILPQFRVNNFVNLSSAVNIIVNNGEFHNDRPVVLDMGNCVFKSDFLILIGVGFENWADAHGEVNNLHLAACSFLQKNHLKIKKLVFVSGDIDLSVIPQTLEKLQIGQNMQIFCTEPIQFPKLNFLSFHNDNDTWQLTHFSNCVNLIELQLIGTQRWIFNLLCVPRSVKILKLCGFQLEFAQDDFNFELDILILQDQHGNSNFADCLNVLGKIKPKVLILVYFENMELDTSDVMRIVYTQRQIGTIIFGSDDEEIDIHKNIPFEGICANQKSNYYKFDNQIGVAITREEFEGWRKMDCLKECEVI